MCVAWFIKHNGQKSEPLYGIYKYTVIIDSNVSIEKTLRTLCGMEELQL